MKLTHSNLLQQGYHVYPWKNIDRIEYWKPIGGTGFDRRVAVHLEDDLPPSVWLNFPHVVHRLRHVHTMEQLEQLHELLNGKED